MNSVSPYTTTARQLAYKTCVECHRSPPSLGLGTGNYAVAEADSGGAVGPSAIIECCSCPIGRRLCDPSLVSPDVTGMNRESACIRAFA